MSSIVKELTIAADPERVFSALTQQRNKGALLSCWVRPG